MPHYPQPYHRAKRGTWYVQIDGVERSLGKDRDEAFRLYHELMGRKPEERAAAVRTPTTVAEIVEAFLEWASKNRDPQTYEGYRRRLQTFIDSIPDSTGCADLKPHHVTRVMDAHDRWGNNTKHDFAVAVQRVFNWAEMQGLIDRSPIRRVEKPGREARELAVGPAACAEVMEAVVEPRLRRLLEFAWESGVRPQEIVKIEARHVMADLKRVVLPPREAKGRKRHRVVYLTDAGLALLAPLIEENPSGPLFRNSEGAPWNKNSVNCAFCRLRLRLAERMMERDGVSRPTLGKVPRKLLSRARAERRAAVAAWKEERLRYAREKVPKFHLGAWRKGYATEAIKAGVDLSTLAGLLGHQDGRMIATVYSKVTQDQEHMARAAEKASRRERVE